MAAKKLAPLDLDRDPPKTNGIRRTKAHAIEPLPLLCGVVQIVHVAVVQIVQLRSGQVRSG